MKYLAYTLLLTAVFLSCQSKNKDQQNSDSTKVASKLTNAATNNEAQQLINEFKPIIQGVWVKKDYIDKVAETKSPLEASDLATDITALAIETRKIIGDSLTFGIGYNNHEGGQMTIKFTKGKKAGCVIAKAGDQLFDIDFKINKKDTILNLYEKANGFQKTSFIKAFSHTKTNDVEEGTSFLINKNIFAGNYFLNGGSEVVFTNDGKVKGLPNIQNYMINKDFVVRIMNNLDGVLFNVYSDDQSELAFKIRKDTLSLYEMLSNADSTELVMGPLRYQLIRKK